jgi:hypothetical protein
MRRSLYSFVLEASASVQPEKPSYTLIMWLFIVRKADAASCCPMAAIIARCSLLEIE